MRRRILIATALVAVSVVVLVGVGIYQSQFVQPQEPVAVVNGDRILTSEFRGRVRLIQFNLLQQYQSLVQVLEFVGDDPATAANYQSQLETISQQLSNPLFVGTTMLQAMIDEQLIEQEAERRGITVTEQDIDSWFEESFGYRGEPTEVVPTATLVPDATPAPTATPFTRELYERTLEAYFTNVGRYDVDEAALRADVRARLYRQRLLETFADEVPTMQEQVSARHILVDDEQTALDLLERLEDGEDWAELAAEFSNDAGNRDQGGDLGWFGRGRMVEPFEQAAFEAEVGEIVGPVETDFGWHLIDIQGHEERQLEGAAYQQALNNHLDEWLSSAAEEADIEIFDYWSERVPSPPLTAAG